VEFNRNIVAYADAALEALRESNRAMSELVGRLAEHQRSVAAQLKVIDELKDIRDHWASWRAEWEHKLSVNEVQFLRSVADIQGAFQHRVTLMEASHRDLMRTHNIDFHAALERHGFDIQKRLWADLDKMHTEIERIIHSELRLLRQRAQISIPAAPAPEGVPAPASPTPLAFDYSRFAERFRGPEEYVTAGQQIYLPYFEGCKNVLDIGCGVGAASLCLAARVPGCRVVGIDRQSELVRLADDNIALNDLASRVTAMHGDLLHPPPLLEPGSFAQIIANPPFLAAGIASPSPIPGKAQASVEGEADLAAWMRFALAMARNRAGITFIHRADRLGALLAELAGRAGDIVVFPLWPGEGKPSKRVIVHARKGGGAALKLMPGLVLHRHDGRNTDEAEAILRRGAPLNLAP